MNRLTRIINLGQKITVTLSEIACETKSGILVEYNNKNAWLPKDKVVIDRRSDSVVVKIPKWLYQEKF